MKHFLHKLLITSLLTCATLSVFAYDFEVDGIYYNKLSESTVAVTYGSTEYIGTVNIPSTITVNGVTYNVTSIGNNAFNDDDDLLIVTIPEGVTSIGEYAFGGCDYLASITIPSEVTSIGYFAFWSCNSLKRVYISSIESWLNIRMGGNAFNSVGSHDMIVNGQKLTDLVIPESITTIGKYAFKDCTSLKSITFHKEVLAVGAEAFSGCSNVNKIICQGDLPPVCGSGALYGISRTKCTLSVPNMSESSYQDMTPWSEFTNIIGGDMDAPDVSERCESPTITFDNETKTLKVESTTNGAKYRCSVNSDDMMTEKAIDSTIQMTGVYDITAYAYADGMYNSEKTTVKLVWVNTENSGSTDIISAETERGVIVSAQNGNIVISGTVDGETISVYNAAGSLVKSIKAQGDNTVIGGLNDNSVYIVNIGGTNVKILVSE